MKKKAQDLKPGDVIPIKDGRVVVIGVRYFAADQVEITGCAADGELMPRFQREFANTLVEVESPTLTPAQQHAGDILMMLMRAVNILDAAGRAPEFAQEAQALLAKIDPPKPPTLEEALTVVSSLYHMGREVDPARLEAAGKMLDRARQAGCLGKDAQNG